MNIEGRPDVFFNARFWVSLISVTSMCSPAFAVECRPSAVLSGHEEAVAELGAILASSNISGEAYPGCPSIWVTVQKEGEVLRVAIQDHLDRRYEREVPDLATAAVLVESWARGDVLTALLPVGPAGGENAAPEQGSVVEPAVTLPEATENEEPSRMPLLMAGADFEVSGGADKSVWFGGRVSLCVELGVSCLGMVLRGGADPMIAGEHKELSEVRSMMEILVAVAFPIRFAGVRVLPAIGFGAGWIQSSTSRPDLDSTGGSVNVETTFGGMRFEGSCHLVFRLSGGLYLNIGATLTTSFIAEEETVEIHEVEIAGEPGTFVRGAVGIAYFWL